jgi:quinol monooxygenase YgiN
MSISFVIAALGCLGAAAATGLLVAWCLRAPNGALVAWTVAMFGLAVSLGAQAVGHAIGFGPVAFRAMEIGASVIAPLALAAGLTEVAGRSVAARFAARLVLPAIAVVCLVVFGSDPLSVTAFSKAWPDPALYYQIIPNDLLKYLLTPVTVVIALLAIGWTGIRSQRDRSWREAVPPVAAAAAAALAVSVPGIVVAAGGNAEATLHVAALFALLCAAAAALTWFACWRVGKLALPVPRQHAGPPAEDEWALQHEWAGGFDETGNLEPLGGDADPYGSLYRHHDDRDYGGAGYQGNSLGRDDYAANGSSRADPGYDDTGYGDAGRFGDAGRDFDTADGAGSRSWRGADVGGGAAEPDGFGGHRVPPDDDDGRAGARLFGQIAIYTLLEERVSDFDRLTRQVVRQVRTNEPDTLVFIVHAVPSAPMQRILYEVYRDRDAYEDHKRQPYVAGFERDRRPYVLATNLIELGLQQAKVSPLPSISDLLSDSGYDLLNDSGFGQPGFGPRPPIRGGSGGPWGGGGPGGSAPPGFDGSGGGVAGSGSGGRPGSRSGPGSDGPIGGPPGAHRAR